MKNNNSSGDTITLLVVVIALAILALFSNREFKTILETSKWLEEEKSIGQ